MLVGKDIQNLFNWFSQYFLPCCCHCQHHDSGVYRQDTLIKPFIDDDDLGVRLFSGHKASFHFLKAFLTMLELNSLYLKKFRFLWTYNSIPLSLIVKIAYLMGKWTTCFDMLSYNCWSFGPDLNLQLGSYFNGQHLLKVQSGLNMLICKEQWYMGSHLCLKKVRSWWTWQWMHVFTFLLRFYPIHFMNISNFVSYLITF